MTVYYALVEASKVGYSNGTMGPFIKVHIMAK
jgi:hypothetical protein